MDLEIATYWNVETLYYVFNAVASVMAGAGFEGLLKMVFLLAIGIAIFAYAGNKQLELATWFIQALIFVTILNMPIARVIITDKTALEPPRVVDNVPFTLAVVAQSTNLVFGFLTSTYETVFGVPDDLGLQKGDVGFGHRILRNVNNATVRDPGLRSDLMQFFKECTLYDIKDGEITPQEIVGGTDTWNTIFSNTSPARFVTYDTLTAAPTTDTCSNVAVILKDRVEAATAAAQTFYGKQAFTRATSDAIAESMFVSTVGTSYDWILNNASNSSEALRQAMFNNIWKDAGSELPALLNDPARVAEVNAMTSSAQAARQAAGANSSISILAQETLPHIRNWIEAIVYAMFPIIVVLMVVSSQEGAKKVLAGYMMSLAWIGMWPVLFAVVNHLSLMHLRYKMRALELATGSGIPFQLSDAFDATLIDEQALIGYMVILVPFIAAGIIKMSQGGIMSLADRMTASFSSAVHGAGYQHSIGNHSMGQAGMDTASVNNTSMHKNQGDIGLGTGGASIGRWDGSVATMSPNGTVALQQLQNRMLTSMGLDRRFEAAHNQEAHRTDIAGDGDRLSYGHRGSSTLNDVTGRDSTRGTSQQRTEQATDGFQGSYSTETGHGQRVDRSHRYGSTWNERSEGRDDMNAGVGVSGGGGRGGAGGAGAPSGGSAADEKRIAEGMRQGGASQTEIDQALQNYRSQQGRPGGGPAGGPSGRGGSRLPFSLGAGAHKSYSASHGKEWTSGTQHNDEEHARASWNAQETGGHQDTRSRGEQSSQTSRHGQDAVYSDAHDRAYERDAVNRREYGTGDRTNRSESDTFTVHRDLMADPHLFAKVAARNGMTPARFANQSQENILRMVEDYVAEKGMVQRAKTMPQETFAGETLPAHAGELADKTLAERRALDEWGGDVRDHHTDNKRAVRAGSTAPLKVDTSVPNLAYQARSRADADLNPENPASLPARAESFNSSVDYQASPDRPTGAARRSELGAAHQIAINDGKDAVDTAVTKAKRGVESATETVKGWFSGDKKD